MLNTFCSNTGMTLENEIYFLGEGKIGRMCFFVRYYFFQDNVLDKWVWRHDSADGCSTKVTYQILTPIEQLYNNIHSNIIWNKVVPLKMSLCAWKTINQRISTKDNLIQCGVVPSGSSFCLNGCRKEESVNHLFLNCDFFSSI